MAIWLCLPSACSICGSIGASGSGGAGSGAASSSRVRPSRDQRTVVPADDGSPPSTSRTRTPGTRAAVPSSASATQTLMPSGSSTVRANRRPSGAQAGTLTPAPSGSGIARCCPPGRLSTLMPVSRRVRRRPAMAGSIRSPASAW